MSENNFQLSSEVYDAAKKLVQVVLPAVSSLYFGLASVWGFPATAQVIGTLAVITTFLGVTIGVSTKNYNASGAAFDGQIVVAENESGGRTFSLELDGDPDDIPNKKQITFKVASPTVPDVEGRDVLEQLPQPE